MRSLAPTANDVHECHDWCPECDDFTYGSSELVDGCSVHRRCYNCGAEFVYDPAAVRL